MSVVACCYVEGDLPSEQQEERERAREQEREYTAAGRMRVLVGVKRVVDYAVKVRIQPDKKGKSIRGQQSAVRRVGQC